MWATQGYLQPFEFAGLDEEDRCNLQVDLQRLLDCSAAAIVPTPAKIIELPTDANE
jgi:hypothetical protein